MEDFVSAPWLRRLFTAVLLGGLVLLGFRVFEPFIVPLVWAGILAFVSWPFYEWLLRACRERRTVAALLMTAAVTAAVIAPLVWLAVVLRIELVRAASHGSRPAIASPQCTAPLKASRAAPQASAMRCSSSRAPESGSRPTPARHSTKGATPR